jgi:opacity protein-like surface antigen
MTRITRTALLLASALLLGPGAAAAQSIPSPFRRIETTQSIHVFGGYMVPDRNVALTDSTSIPLGPEAGPVFGVRYQIRASGPLSLEGSVGISPTQRRLFAPKFLADSTRIEIENLGVDVPSLVVMGDVGLRFHLTGPRTWNGLAPFVVGMGGMVGDLAGGDPAEEEAELDDLERFRLGPSFAVGAGLGTDWFPAQNVSLRLELTGRLWRMNTPEGFSITRTERGQWNPVAGLTVGGAFHF